MFFLHQKKVGADAGDEVTRTLWEYAICNLTEPDGEFGPVKYVKGKIYELETGYKNMLTLMCRCAKALFPEKDKDIEAAYVKVKDCPEYEFNANLTSAITDVFKLFNQHNPVVTSSNDKVSIVYSDLGNLKFDIRQSGGHGNVDHNPSKKTILTEEEIRAIKKSENDFTKMLAKFTSNRKFNLLDDFHKLFFGECIYYDEYSKEFNLTLSSGKVINSDFLSRYQALRFLKYSQGEERNFARIEELLQMYVRFNIDYSLIMRLPDGETTNFTDFVFHKYGASINNSYDDLKGFELINRNKEVTITSFGNSAGWVKNNTNTKFRYTLDESGNAILYPMEDKENLYIPNTITTEKGTFNVSGIGYRACYSSEILRRVVIEGGATALQIKSNAFDSCHNLESITIHSTGELRTLNIGKAAFYKSGIESFVVPDSVSELQIESFAFGECQNLKTFKLPLNPNFRTLNISESVFSCTGIESFVVPDSISELQIESCAFWGCQNLKMFKLPSNPEFRILNIGEIAFNELGIESFIVPDSVSDLKIGGGAFWGCQNLKTFKLPSNPEFRI